MQELENQKKSRTLFGHILISLRVVFSNPLFLFLAVSLSCNLLLLYYFIFLQTTTFSVFWQSNSPFYNFASIGLTILIAVLFGIAASFFIWQWKENKEKNIINSGNGLIGAFLGAVSMGCPVCGAWLISFLGIGGGLAVFPFQGLEIKTLSALVLGFSIVVSSKPIANDNCLACQPQKDNVFSPEKEALKLLKHLALGIGALLLIIYLPFIGSRLNLGISFQSSKGNALLKNTAGSINNSEADSPINEKGLKINSSALLEEINPSAGYTIDAVYGNIGPKLLESGAINFNKLKTLYEKTGYPLTKEQIKILTEGSNEKITINQDNAYFLINFLWALGLVNKNPILDEGPLIKYGGLGKIGSFASTGGWTLGTKTAAELYSKSEIISLDKRKQDILDDFANNSYRPCCNNSTAFADCNHGMAALGLGEIMAENNASAEEMFEALKYFNAFWFPQQYLDLAKYFKIREGKDWDKVDARMVMGKDYSTASGWQRVKNWLASNNAVEKAPSKGGGCGV